MNIITRALPYKGGIVLRIVDEPTAAAVSYLWNADKSRHVLVVDMGGGTFDCALIRHTKGRRSQTFVVEATSGDNALGGQDFVHAMVQLAQKQLPEIPLEELLVLCEEAKKNGDPEIIFSARGKRCCISQADYERSLSKQVGAVLAVLEETLRFDTTADVILAGGGSFQPIYDRAVRSRLAGRKFLPPRPASEVVAEGAAILTRAEELGIHVTAVLPRSVGINSQKKVNSHAYRDNQMTVIIPRNTPIPSEIGQTFFAVNKEETVIQVYEGEHRKASDNIHLDDFSIKVPRDTRLRVVFSVDSKAQLCVTAASHNGKVVFPVRRKHAELPPDELQALQRKAVNRFASCKPASPVAKGTDIGASAPGHCTESTRNLRSRLRPAKRKRPSFDSGDPIRT